MVHGVWVVINVHPNCLVLYVDVINAFNAISRKAIFQEPHTIKAQLFQFFPFVWSFYAKWVPLFCIHHSPLGDLSIIHSLEGTHQSNLLIGPFFVLAHFCALWCYVWRFFPLVFSLPLWMTFTSLVRPLVFILPLTIFFFIWHLWAHGPTLQMFGLVAFC